MNLASSIVHNLRVLQSRHGYLPRKELVDLADLLGTPLHRLQEVASCFPHFRLEGAGGAPNTPPQLHVEICKDMACHLRGADKNYDALHAWAEAQGKTAKDIEVHYVSCLGRCDRAPAMRFNEHCYLGRGPEETCELVSETFAKGHLPPCDWDATLPRHQKSWKIDIYEGKTPDKRYRAVREFLRAYPSADYAMDEEKKQYQVSLIQDLEAAALLGMGGAGAPAFKKWSDVLHADGGEGDDYAKYIVCNADESEPATFKDRELLIRTPHIVLEGIILAGLLVNAKRGYVYIRHEYEEAIDSMRRAIREAEAMRVCGERILGYYRSFPVEVFVSPGGYICGEQTALLEAMEDRRAEPRNRPPEIPTNGLYNKPTLLSNVETFAWVPAIFDRGGLWYRNQGRDPATPAPSPVNLAATVTLDSVRQRFGGFRLFSISGDVAKPGVYEVPIGITLRELIWEYCGGMRHGRAFKAVAPSGPSGGFLPARIPTKLLPDRFVKENVLPGDDEVDVLDIPLDLNHYRSGGLMLGAGLVVYADGTDMVDQALNSLDFYRRESCGKCVPCRLGSQQLVQLTAEIIEGNVGAGRFLHLEPELQQLFRTMEMTAICGLGAVAFQPLSTLLKYFRPELEAYLKRNGG